MAPGQQCFRFEDEDWRLVHQQVEDWSLNLEQLHSQSLRDYEYSFNYSTDFVLAMDHTKVNFQWYVASFFLEPNLTMCLSLVVVLLFWESGL